MIDLNDWIAPISVLVTSNPLGLRWMEDCRIEECPGPAGGPSGGTPQGDPARGSCLIHPLRLRFLLRFGLTLRRRTSLLLTFFLFFGLMKNLIRMRRVVHCDVGSILPSFSTIR